MSVSDHIADVPAEINTPGAYAKWLNEKLRELTADLSPDEAEKIRQQSVSVITEATLKWTSSNPAIKKEGEKAFRDYYHQVQAAIEANGSFNEARSLAEAENSPTMVGHVAKFVGDMDVMKASLIGGLLGKLGLHGLSENIGRLRNLEMMVSGLSGGKIGVFSKIGDVLNQLDGKLTALNVNPAAPDVVGHVSHAAGGALHKASEMLPPQVAGLLGKFLSPPGDEDPLAPARPKNTSTTR